MHSRWLHLWLGRKPRFATPAYHCTSDQIAAKIRRAGFQRGSRGKFGEGVYLTADEPACEYGPAVVRVAVRLSNPLDTTFPKMKSELGDIVERVDELVRKNSPYDSQSQREDDWGRLARREVEKRGYDGIVLDGGSGTRGEIVIYDLAAVRVIEDLAE